MIKILLIVIATCLASENFIRPKLTENLEDPPRLTQCMREQVATALNTNANTIWGFQGPFLISGSPRLATYYVRTAAGYLYKLHFTTSLHNHWRLFQYVSANGLTRIGATAQDMWAEAYLFLNDTDDEPVFVSLVPCRKFF